MALIAVIPFSEVNRRGTLCADDYIPSNTKDLQDIEQAKQCLKAAQTRLKNIEQKAGDNEMLRRKYQVKTV
jgi:hypothetical protein